MNKDFELLNKIPTKRFIINGITYSRDDVENGRFTRIISDSSTKGMLHVNWRTPQRAFVNDYGNSVNEAYHVKARECICSGFIFNENDLSYIED